MSDKKMIHVFNEMVVKAGRSIDTAELHFINGGVSATFFCAQQAHHAAHAINNHDRLVEENAELKKENEIIEPLVAEKQSLITGLMKENTELRAMLGNIAVSMECNHGVDTDSIFELLDKYK